MNKKITKWYWNDTHGLDIVFTLHPKSPENMLTQHDKEYLDPDNPESTNFTKKSFWENDIMNSPKILEGFYDSGRVIQADKLPDGTWNFRWDSGEISGFIEGEDFNFISEDKLSKYQ